MRTFFSILLTLVVINPFCACGAVRGDAHAVEKVFAEACGHSHCQHEDQGDEEPEAPCECDHQAEFVTPGGGTIVVQMPQFAVIADIAFAINAELTSPSAVGYRSTSAAGRLPAAAAPLWRYHCALML